MDDLILSFISEQAKKELLAAQTSLNELLQTVKTINQNQVKIEAKTGGSGDILSFKNNVDSLNKSQELLARTLTEVKRQQDALSITQSKTNALAYDEAVALQKANLEYSIRKKNVQDAAKEQSVLWQEMQKAKQAAEALEKANTLLNQQIKEGAIRAREMDKELATLGNQMLKGAANAHAIEQERLAKQFQQGAILARELDKEIALLNKQMLQGELRAKEMDAELEKMNNAYNRLNAQHKAAVASAQAIGAQYNITSKQFVEAKDKANALGDKLLAIDAQLGNHRRNVGNYSSAWNGLGNSINQIARELPNFAQSIQLGILAISNNLPILQDEIRALQAANKLLIEQGKPTVSIGKQILSSIISWQTALVVGITVLVAYGKEIGEFFTGVTKATKEAEKAQKKYAEAIKDSTKETTGNIVQETTKLQALNAVATDSTLRIEQRRKAALEMQKTWPATLGFLSQEAILEGQAKDAIEATTRAIIAQANAQGARKQLGLAAENTQALQDQLDLAKQALDLAKENKKQFGGVSAGGYEAFPQSTIDNAQNSYNKIKALRDKSLLDQDKYAKRYLDYTKQIGIADSEAPEGTLAGLRKEISDKEKLLELAKIDGEEQKKLTAELIVLRKQLKDIEGKQTAKGRQPHDTIRAELKGEQDLLAAQRDRAKFRLETDSENQRLIFENEKNKLNDRLVAYAKFETDKEAIAKINRDTEIQQLNTQLSAIETAEGKSAGKRTNYEKDLILQKEAILERKKLAEDKYQYDVTKISDDGEKARRIATDKYYADYIQKVIDQEAAITLTYKVQQDAREKELTDKRNKGLISQREYTRQLQNLAINTQDAAYTAQINFIESNKVALEQAGVDVDKLIKELNRLKAAKAGLKDPAQDNNSGISAQLGLTEQDVKDAQFAATQFMSIANSLQQYLNAQTQERLNALEKENALIDEQKDKKLKAIGLQILSEEERLKRTSAAEAEADAKHKQIEQRKKQEQRQQAQRDKAFAIAQIIINTALAVTHELTTGLPATAAARAIAVGFVGAAELAVAIATPIPSFEKGGKIGKDTFANISEKGSELQINPDGTMQLTPDKHTIAYLKKGTQIIPHEKTMEIMRLASIHAFPLIPKQEYNNDDVVGELKEVRKAVVGAIRNKQFTNYMPNDYSKPSNYWH